MADLWKIEDNDRHKNQRNDKLWTFLVKYHRST